jgi:hypothetical protein
MKGKQIAFTLYLPPRKYWELKVLSRQLEVSMQDLVRDALDETLVAALRGWPKL